MADPITDDVTGKHRSAAGGSGGPGKAGKPTRNGSRSGESAVSATGTAPERPTTGTAPERPAAAPEASAAAVADAGSVGVDVVMPAAASGAARVAKHRAKKQAEAAEAETRKAAEASAADTARMLMAMADTFAVGVAGPQAALNEQEKMLIAESLPKVLASVTPAVAARAQAVAYPAMLAMGVGGWLFRVYGLTQEKAKEARAASRAVQYTPAEPTPAAPAATAGSGASGPEPTTTATGRSSVSPDALLASPDMRAYHAEQTTVPL